jgi:hypothetical protein
LRYKELFTPHHVALLVDWFEEKSELCVEVYIPHSGGGSSYYTVHSLRELKFIVENTKSLEVQFSIWKNYKQSEFESDEAGVLNFDLKWIYLHSDEVMYISVGKNRNWTESYAKNPEKYAAEVQEWSR